MVERAMNNRANAACPRLAAATDPPPCPRCGAIDTVIGQGSGPHAAREQCAGCGRFHRWLPKTMTDGDDEILSLIDDED